MRKRFAAVIMICVFECVFSITAMAGQWFQDHVGWWYQRDDKTYLNNGWNWIDGKCYYFNGDGYCLVNTQTPDGYTVDANGAWTANGAVQTRGAAEQPSSSFMQIDTINFVVPSGFSFSHTDEDGYYFVNADYSSAIGLLSQTIPDFEQDRDTIYLYQEKILDHLLNEAVGAPKAKRTVQYAGGAWYCYQYTDVPLPEIPGAMEVYGRIYGGRIQIVMFAGAISSLDTEGIMNNCIGQID